MIERIAADLIERHPVHLRKIVADGRVFDEDGPGYAYIKSAHRTSSLGNEDVSPIE